MRIDGDQPDDKLLANLCAGQALSEQAQHLHFACGEFMGRASWPMRPSLLLACLSWLGLGRRCVVRLYSLGNQVLKRHHTTLLPGRSKRCFVSLGADALQRALILHLT